MLAFFLAIVWFSITIDDGPTTDLCSQLNAARGSLKEAGWQGVDVFYEANCEPEQATPTTTALAGLQLKTAPESDGGITYGRWMYEQGGWGDADDDGCDTREEVLVAEARTLDSDDDDSCVPEGTWWSWYDERTITRASGVDIDHMVPLAEVHASGGWRWSNERRYAYANDLTLPQTLTAVSSSSNRSKGGRDPVEWKPPEETAWCQYAQDWIAVKVFWGLTADAAEVSALRTMLEECEEDPVIVLPTPTPTPSPTMTPSATVTGTPTVTATPTPRRSFSRTPTPAPSATRTPRPSLSPTPTPALSPTPSPRPAIIRTPTPTPLPTQTPTPLPSTIPTPSATATPIAKYARCAEAIAAGEERVQGSSGSGRGFPIELFTDPPRDGDGDGIVCET